jgi:hypothetical protein
VIYQHPLGYLLGLEGLALLRAFNGEHGRSHGPLAGHAGRRTTAWAAMTRPPSKVSAGEPYSSYPWSSASLTRWQNSASSGPVSSR